MSLLAVGLCTAAPQSGQPVAEYPNGAFNDRVPNNENNQQFKEYAEFLTTPINHAPLTQKHSGRARKVGPVSVVTQLQRSGREMDRKHQSFSHRITSFRGGYGSARVNLELAGKHLTVR